MPIARILGVILAGGASRRFGSDKSAAPLCGRPLLERVVERARPQVETLLLNANDPEVGQSIPDLELLADSAPGEGPLAGILTTLGRAGRRGFDHVASFACDTPFFPLDTVSRLAHALQTSSADFAIARCGATAHRIFALWPVACRDQLDAAFAQGARSMAEVEDWLVPAWAEFAAEGGPDGDPFFNINTPADLETAERWLASRGAASLC
ncbi:MAG TPA: molybdenum cofactor guanylyltransferase MobA [Rhizomicrobium sp.]|jgi:molybdopterin-guanine dinucleotide biosynthesis protein A|nr:molybdenum cofactor guanylyltransferase MobA [Rhizomicrobium sp.]